MAYRFFKKLIVKPNMLFLPFVEVGDAVSFGKNRIKCASIDGDGKVMRVSNDYLIP